MSMSAREPIAIVRMAGLFPGALNHEAFWENIVRGHNAIKDVPAGRWEVNPGHILDDAPGNPDRSYARAGGFVEGFQWDPKGVGVDAALVADLDPLFHWVLALGRTLTDGVALPAERTGVALANLALPSEAFSRLGRVGWRTLLRLSLGPHADALPSLERAPHPLNHFQAGLPAGLLAQSLGLQGGTLGLDAACASSLYAVKLACDQLHLGRADAMIAGGVTRTDPLCLSVGFSQLRAISRSGRSRPFDAAADGLIPGEGCGLVLLKRLSDAVAHDDEVLAVIRSVGLSNDGKARGVLMPSSEGQIRAMRAAYAAGEIEPARVGLLECHATGTPVGDLAEVQSLKAVWGNPVGPSRVALGSVKSMIGHLLTTAGAAGLIKTIHALRHQVLPPTLNFEQPQAGMDFERSPFFVNTRPRAFEAPAGGGPRLAGVSAFGFGGCNAHLVLEEATVRARAPKSPHRPRPGDRPAEPLAIVGMACRFGVAANLHAYKELLFEGTAALAPVPDGRWFGVEGHAGTLPRLVGSYLTGLAVDDPMKLRIPPAEVERMLSHQLLALLVVADLARTPGLFERLADRTRVGVVMGFAMEADAGDFAFRWATQRDAAVESDPDRRAWLTHVLETSTRKITAEPVLGFLANLIANRVSSRFDLGGPSLALSAEEASALKALDVAAAFLRQGDADAMLVGGVDLPADVRALWLTDAVQGWSRTELRVFDQRADGSLPGEGAGVILLKRLGDARRDGDQILAVVEGVGCASGGLDGAPGKPSARAHALAIRRAHEDAGTRAEQVGLWSVHGSGRPAEDAAEIEAIHDVAGGPVPEPRTALMATKPVVGHTGAASGMASLMGAVLALQHRALPPVRGAEEPRLPQVWRGSPYYAPRKARPWLANASETPRRAGVSAMAVDGNHVHVVLREEPQPGAITALSHVQEQVFVMRGDNRHALVLEAQRLLQASVGADLERLAMERAATHLRGGRKLTLAVVATDTRDLHAKLEKAIRQLNADAVRIDDIHGIYFAQDPLAWRGQVAFVFPGAGNSYPGMGRELVLRFPELLDRFSARTEHARARTNEYWVLPRQLVTKRAPRDDVRSPQEMIWAGGYYTQMLSEALRGRLGIHPHVAIGYSLGESSGLFALGAWNAIDEMHDRLAHWPLFTTELAGPMEAVLRAWKRRGVDVEPMRKKKDFWSTYLLVASPQDVLEAVSGEPLAHLAIINAPDECMLAGETAACKRVIEKLKCSAHFTPFLVAVHVPEVEVTVDEYRRIHLLPTVTPPGVTYYSSGTGRPYLVNQENAAQSVVEQAIRCVDFPRLIRTAYEDGVRIFVEVGPRGSCTRWTDKILEGREYVAVASDRKGRSEFVNLAHVGAQLAAHGVDVDVASFYGAQVRPLQATQPSTRHTYPLARSISLDKPPAGYTRYAPNAAPPAVSLTQTGDAGPGRGEANRDAPTPLASAPSPEAKRAPVATLPTRGATFNPTAPRAVTLAPAPHAVRVAKTTTVPSTPQAPVMVMPTPTISASLSLQAAQPSTRDPLATLLAAFQQTFTQIADTHRQFLETNRVAQEALIQIIGSADTSARDLTGLWTVRSPLATAEAPRPGPTTNLAVGDPPSPLPRPQVPAQQFRPAPTTVFNYGQCLEFAGGKIGGVFGEGFADADAYPVRVRLPNPPLLLCHRVTDLKAGPRTMHPGTMDTESDHTVDTYFVHRGFIPCGITVESGQADLMLVSYLGIDAIVKGEKRYRLLDCELTFEDLLPQAGKTLHYHISIDRFVEQSGTHIFFFKYDLTVDGKTVLRMRNGCAGFFSQEALQNSMGIVLPPKHKLQARQGRGSVVKALCQKSSLSDGELAALSHGNLVAALGPQFAPAAAHPEPLTIATGKMQLLHRVVQINPEGGACGLGVVVAETDVHPDDWFFPCHFRDDEVMAGSLMYETCVQAAQIFMLHLGQTLEYPDGMFHPIPGQTAKVKCRGQVLTDSKKITYRLDILERGTEPEPYLVAEANCLVDGKHIVWAQNLTLRIVGNRISLSDQRRLVPECADTLVPPPKPLVFSREQIVEHGTGTPSKLWGPDYAVFDQGRRMARLPNGPYLLLDRVTDVGQPAQELSVGAWLAGDCDVPQSAWYFDAQAFPTMPFSVLLEVFLQPCGMLASYMGCDLRCTQDRRFRNLGGDAILHREVLPGSGALTTHAKLTKFNEYSDMLIVHFDVTTTQNGRPLMEGTSYFGFFTDEALANQKGLTGKLPPKLLQLRQPQAWDLRSGTAMHALLRTPRSPVLMLDRVVAWDPSGGRHKKGYIRAEKDVDPSEWFFDAHFYQDPVMPGSLGVDALLQLMQVYLMKAHPGITGVRFAPVMLGRKWEWTYRGQVTRKNKLVTLEVEIVEAHGGDEPFVVADAFLMVDGLSVYRLDGVAMQMVRA
jgi:PfaB family protein